MQTISNLLSAKPEKAAEAVSHLKEESGRKDGEINRLWQRILTMQADVYPQGQKALAVFEQGMTPVWCVSLQICYWNRKKERPCWCALAMTRQVITTQPEASVVICVHSEKN